MPGISILRQRDILLATLPSTLTDRELARLRRDLLDRIGRDRSRAVILDVTAVDEGPGIADLTLALQDGYSTGNGLGLGLPGTRRISDEFEIRSKPGQGVWVRIAKRVAP